MQTLNVEQGEFKLARYPFRKNEQLRAWDAADEYLLDYFSEHIQKEEILNILIVNDVFAALTTVLSQHNITFWTDSWISQKSLSQNIELNHLSLSQVHIKKSTEEPGGAYNVVLIKIPKTLALLEDQLIRIKPFLTSGTKVVAAGMVKSIHTSTLKLFEKYIGATKTSLAKKKARLIFSQPEKLISSVKSLYPQSYILENTQYTIVNHANVFSRDSLDIGTRFFLQHIPQAEKYKKIIDLACGNGVVGLIAAEKNPAAEIIFIDESFMAVESAKENFHASLNIRYLNRQDINSQSANCQDSNITKKAQFIVNDCLDGIEQNSVDLILNNPPFHQNNAVGDDVAWKMFKQSKQVLKQKGELWVIGNRHLGYHLKLKKLFAHCEIIASNKKFVVLKAVK